MDYAIQKVINTKKLLVLDTNHYKYLPPIISKLITIRIYTPKVLVPERLANIRHHPYDITCSDSNNESIE